MHPKSPKLLEDVRAAAAFVMASTRDRSESTYLCDVVLRFAVERNFEIIGEALGRLAKIDPETAARVTDLARIIAFRNVLIHAYDHVDHRLV
ncbi:MAG: HepT-like ribonuclease domain-containing protein [Thermoflexales bacterium]